MRVLRSSWTSHTFQARPEIVTLNPVSGVGVLQRSINYLRAVWPALVFGILISAAVRAFVSPEWLAGVLKRRSIKTQLTAGIAGAPLMLCSCCVAPIFTTVAETSQRVGPALGLMFASPALNPAALALTFMLFEPRIAFSRAVLAVFAVIAIGPAVERMFRNKELPIVPRSDQTEILRTAVGMKFAYALGAVMVRTVPGLLAGIVVSMFIVDRLPAGVFESSGARGLAILAAATVAVPLALPTFVEIPLALGLLAAGFPAGAAVALLFAGPVVNLPSLFSVARVGSWRLAVVVAIMVWIFAVGGGLLIG
jgi:hypothetical protein